MLQPKPCCKQFLYKKLLDEYSTIICCLYYTQKKQKTQLFGVKEKFRRKSELVLMMFSVVSVSALDVDALVEEGAVVGLEVFHNVDALKIEKQHEVGYSQHNRLYPVVGNVQYRQHAYHYHYAHHN